MVICDEMAFMKNTMFTEVILPLLGMGKTKLLGISTPSPDEYNFFTRMLTLKRPNSNKHAYGSLTIDLACDECKRKKRAVDCRHLLGLIPKWKGQKKFEMAAQLYGDLFSSYHARESMGLLLSSEDKIFDKDMIGKMDHRPMWYNKSRECMPTHIFMSVDPNAGGTSQMAIVSMAWVKNTYMVCFSFYFFYSFYQSLRSSYPTIISSPIVILILPGVVSWPRLFISSFLD